MLVVSGADVSSRRLLITIITFGSSFYACNRKSFNSKILFRHFTADIWRHSQIHILLHTYKIHLDANFLRVFDTVYTSKGTRMYGWWNDVELIIHSFFLAAPFYWLKIIVCFAYLFFHGNVSVPCHAMPSHTIS